MIAGGARLRLTSLVDLIRDPDPAVRQAAGLVQVDQLAGAGRYTRTAPWTYRPGAPRPTAAGVGNQLGALEQDYPALYRVVLQDAIVTGQGTLITRDGRLIHDSCWEMLHQQAIVMGIQCHPDGSLVLSESPSRRIAGATLLLKRPWWRNYGHWLVDTATLLALAPNLMMPADWQALVGDQDDGMGAVARGAMDLIAPGLPVLEHRDQDTWRVDVLHYTTPLSRPGLFKLPQGLAALRAHLPGSALPRLEPRNLYIARPDQLRRRLVNEDAVIALCQARGFQVIRPEALALRDQAKLFQSAGIVVGVKGSGLANLLFCTSSAAAVVLTPDGWPDRFFWDLAGQLGMDYREVIGDAGRPGGRPSHDPFSVDVDLVAQALDDLQARDRSGAPAAPAPVAPSPAPTAELTGEPGVWAHVQDAGDVAAAFHQAVGGAQANQAIEAFGIVAPDDIQPEELQYCGVVGHNWTTPWQHGGAPCGTRGLNLPLFGLAIRLSGAARRRYRCGFTAVFADGTVRWMPADGTSCASDSLAPLIRLTVELDRVDGGDSPES